MRQSTGLTPVLMLSICSVLQAIVGCDHSSTDRSLAVITRPGSYLSHDGKFVALVSIDQNKEISYRIVESNSAHVLQDGKAGNSFMKFFMCWDNGDNFWIDTENTSRVILFKNNEFKARDIKADDLKPGTTFPRPPAAFVNSK